MKSTNSTYSFLLTGCARSRIIMYMHGSLIEWINRSIPRYNIPCLRNFKKPVSLFPSVAPRIGGN